MKFIHAADLHLDSTSTKLKKLYGQKEVSIVEATHNAFISLINYALDEKVDFLLIAGDLFDANWKDYSIGLFFIEQIKRLSCPIYYIRGNHDSENRLFKTLPFPENLKIYKSDEPQTIVNHELKIAVHGQSYAQYHIKDDLAESYPNAIAGYFNIGLLHTSGEKQNKEQPYAPYDLKKLLMKKYDYWALGHIHTPQIISEKPHIVYSGVLQGRHVKEVGAKGCYLVSVDLQQNLSINFKQLGVVNWEVICINLSYIESEEAFKETLLNKISNLLENYPLSMRFVVRLILEGKSSIEKWIHKNEDYYRNAIYCWLEDNFQQRVCIEKIIDRVDYQSALSNVNTQNTIWNFIQKSLNSQDAAKEAEKLFLREKESIEQKIPAPVLEEIQTEESILNSDDHLINIKHYLEKKISEISYENSPS